MENIANFENENDFGVERQTTYTKGKGYMLQNYVDPYLQQAPKQIESTTITITRRRNIAC